MSLVRAGESRKAARSPGDGTISDFVRLCSFDASVDVTDARKTGHKRRTFAARKGWFDWTAQTWAVTISFVGDADPLERRLPIAKDHVMGDKGGKKDKEKSQKQKSHQQKQKTKGKQEKAQPKQK